MAVKKFAYIYKDLEACLTAFREFTAGPDYQRSNSGLWYASHEDTHNFFSPANLEKLRGTDWYSIEIAEDVSAEDRVIIFWNCMNTGITAVPVTVSAAPTKIQSQGG